MDASGQEVEEEESTAAPTEELESSPKPNATEVIPEANNSTTVAEGAWLPDGYRKIMHLALRA